MKKNTSKEQFNFETVVMGLATGKLDTDYSRFIHGDVRLKRLLESVKLSKGKMLDNGCGGRTIANCLAYKYPTMKLFSCDISKTALNLSKKSKVIKTSFLIINNNRFPFILPKELLEYVLGFKHVENYYDRSIVTKKESGKNELFMIIRTLWQKIYTIFNSIECTQSRILNDSEFIRWKVSFPANIQ